jgi:hypothetical protein
MEFSEMTNQDKLYDLMQLQNCPKPLEISEDELNYQLGEFSRNFQMENWNNANEIAGKLRAGGGKPKVSVTTFELYNKSFSFPKVRNYDYAVTNMNELEAANDNLNANLSNGLALKKFLEVAKRVRSNLNDKYSLVLTFRYITIKALLENIAS